MSKLNMKEWINEIIQKKEVVAMPIMTHPGIEMIGKTVRDAVTDGQVHYNAIKALVKISHSRRNRDYGFDGRSRGFRSGDCLPRK